MKKMIPLTKMNGDALLVAIDSIEAIETFETLTKDEDGEYIHASNLFLSNGHQIDARESLKEIVEKCNE